MQEGEEIRCKLHSGTLTDEEAVELGKQFVEIKKKAPEVIIP